MIEAKNMMMETNMYIKSLEKCEERLEDRIYNKYTQIHMHTYTYFWEDIYLQWSVPASYKAHSTPNLLRYREQLQRLD